MMLYVSPAKVQPGRARRARRARCMAASPDYSEYNVTALSGKRVAFTAQRGYATRLSALLTDANARPVWCPMVQSMQLKHEEDYRALDRAILRLQEYDLVVFTSKATIEAFRRRLLKFADGDADLARAALNGSGVKLAALGRDAINVKRLLGRAADITPIDPSLAGLVNHLAGMDSLMESHILCLMPQPQGLTEPKSMEDFLRALGNGGAVSYRIDACAVAPTKAQDTELERRQILSGDVDVLLFTSSEEADAFGLLVSPLALPDTLVIAALGPHTEFQARCVGFDVKVVSPHFLQLEGLLEKVGKELDRKNPPTSLILPE